MGSVKLDHHSIVAVIPALNEEKSIVRVVSATKTFADVIVVDDGSSDLTAKLAMEHGAIVVSHTSSRGYDGALNSGFEKALDLQFRKVITLDADGQLPAHLIPEFESCLDRGADLVVGQRNRKPRVSEHLFAYFTRTFLGIRDPFCGMKAYNMDSYVHHGFFDNYRSIGSQLALRIARDKSKVVNIPILVADRDGQSRMGSDFQAELKIFRASFIGFINYIIRKI